ncbi:MAG: YkgJ family cysteine cluster protein, partial [Haloferacaceae archaeon]
MEVDCQGCAGCCLDWRPLADEPSDHERRGGRPPVDDAYNLVPLVRDEVRDFVAAGLGDALVPRLFAAGPDEEGVTVDGVDLAAADGRPVFVVGLRKPPKPVAPFGGDRRWLRACAFLDPATLKCRIHGGDRYPSACRDYPGHNLALGEETECERVERAFGGERLVDGSDPETAGLALGPAALGAKVFAHPDPDRIAGAVARLRAGEPTAADRATFVGAAVGSRPGSLTVDERRAAT